MDVSGTQQLTSMLGVHTPDAALSRDSSYADGFPVLTVNAAAAAKAPTGGTRREGKFLDLDEVVALAQACRGPYAELVYVLAMQGLRWGELAGLQVGDRVMVPGPGLRLSRAGSSKQRGRRAVRRHVEEQARSDCPAGAGGGAHRGSVERRQEPG
jgi:integrase